MSDAQDYRTKAAEFAHLANKATSLKDIRELRQQAQAFRSLVENEEWVVANRDRLISNRVPTDGRIGYGRAGRVTASIRTAPSYYLAAAT